MLLDLEPRGARSRVWTYASPLLAIALTVLVVGLFFAAIGKAPGRAVAVFFVAPLLGAGGLAALFVKAAPLILIATGLCVCYRANVWNIGAEGQFTLGAIAGGGVALGFPDAPFWLLYPAVLVAGVAGGTGWAAITAWLRTRFNANEILTSLMLSYVAQLLLTWLVTGPWRDPQGFGFPQTAEFGAGATTPMVAPGIYLGCLAAQVLALLVWLLLRHSVLGFELRVMGQAPRAARFAGFGETRLVWIAMLASGAMAGLAGVFEVTGPIGQLTNTISPGYGFTAVIVAFLGRLHPLGVVLAGLLLALSYLGGNAAQIDLGTPAAVTGIFQGILLFLLLGSDVLILYRVRRRAGAA
ncbi:MAG: ABC transporter permease [Rhodospirillales bacterium]|nr:ABC transporter permease [Rhodospirillales bacterium]